MKKSNDEEDIKVNKRRTDKVYFESTLLQQISDGIDFIRDQSKEILSEIDLKGLDNIDIDEFGEYTLDQISDISDELSQLKSELFDSDDFPTFIKEYTLDAKRALNRDDDYVRRAQRRLDRHNSGELVNVYKTNARIIELCDKAIEVNSSNADAYYVKGRALMNLDKYPEAIEEFINSLAIEDDIKVWIAIANSNTLNGDYDDAIGIYEKILERDENSFDAVKGKALTYYASGDFAKANEEFKNASSMGTLDSTSKEIWDECLENI
ncbi:MAG: tetratricopeptide repeat protein [Methanobrevibacter thaueri]|jgi:tetratricopeptide (TPR) repeat protein|uniref:tetratricopeptide repeat protein n=1 Tax=Methanobrevibacter thaueri TaxID=190975 RepID=UPI0026EF96ED|nr:tetratricopeptide repeat protein [Methanobrevibacter thaueri]MBE6494878.1 tetratricopeptide repeat protein [Methanobrevibacter thaueri]